MKRCFEQGFKVEAQFSHDGGERDFGRFATTTQGLIEGFEEQIVRRSAEGLHGLGTPPCKIGFSDLARERRISLQIKHFKRR